MAEDSLLMMTTNFSVAGVGETAAGSVYGDPDGSQYFGTCPLIENACSIIQLTFSDNAPSLGSSLEIACLELFYRRIRLSTTEKACTFLCLACNFVNSEISPFSSSLCSECQKRIQLF